MRRNGFLGAKNLDTGGKAITALGGDWVASEMERQMMNETRFPPNEPLGVNITINVSFYPGVLPLDLLSFLILGSNNSRSNRCSWYGRFPVAFCSYFSNEKTSHPKAFGCCQWQTRRSFIYSITQKSYQRGWWDRFWLKGWPIWRTSRSHEA